MTVAWTKVVLTPEHLQFPKCTVLSHGPMCLHMLLLFPRQFSSPPNHSFFTEKDEEGQVLLGLKSRHSCVERLHPGVFSH